MIRQLLQLDCRYTLIMKRTALIIVLLFAALDTGAVWAQDRPGGGGGGRHVEERRAQQPAPRNDGNRGNQQVTPPAGQQVGQGGGQRMSPEERRQLREQIRNHGRENYTPAKR